MITGLFHQNEFMVLIKNKYAYFNIKNFLRFLKSEEKEKIKDYLKSNMEQMSKKDIEKYSNFLNSISDN